MTLHFEPDYCPTESWKEIDYDHKAGYLPEESGVYAVFDNQDRCLYVGQSKPLYHRLGSHDLRKDFTKWKAEYIRYVLTDKQVELERHIINAVKPILNTAHNRSQSFDGYSDEYGTTPFIFRAREW